MKFVTQTAILNGVLTDSVEIGCKQLDEVKWLSYSVYCVGTFHCYFLDLTCQDVAKIDRKSMNFNSLGKAYTAMYWVLEWCIKIPGFSTPADWLRQSFGETGKKFTLGQKSKNNFVRFF